MEVIAMRSNKVAADDINLADGIVIPSPVNFGYMAGLAKNLFDRTFLDIGGALSDDGSGLQSSGRKPYALAVHERQDTGGAVHSLQSTAQALPWTQVAEPLQIVGDVTDADRAAASELAATVSGLLS